MRSESEIEVARLREREAQLKLQVRVIDEGSIGIAYARAEAAETRVAELEEALRELERAATEYANENGVSGDLGARLYDARRVLEPPRAALAQELPEEES